MVRANCTRNVRRNDSVSFEQSTPSETAVLAVRPKPCRKLIEQTRELMERSIEFVPHPDFDNMNALKEIQNFCPTTQKQGRAAGKPEPGIAFVSGLVEAPLLTPDEERYWFTWMNFLKFRAERNRRRLDLTHLNSALVKQIQSDLDEAIQARNHIIQANLRLIVALARKLTTSIDSMSDLISEGMSPLIRSVELFDISLGNRFSTYGTWAVRNQMIRWLKRARSQSEFQTSDMSCALESLPDRRPLVQASEETQQTRLAAVHQLLDLLTQRERQIITARFALEGQPHGQSLAEIAEQMGLSKERVRQIALTSLEKLREQMTFEEFEALT
jgi:RNA polymerase sigma factor (sigma-70 family)